MSPPLLRIAMLSIHSSPVGALGTQDTGGMSVYLRELAAELGRRGHKIDIFTAAPAGEDPAPATLGPNVRLVHLDAGPGDPAGKLGLYPRLPAVFRSLERFRAAGELSYDLVHSHYWLSGRVGAWARDLWDVPHVVMFHTLGAVKNLVGCGEDEPPLRLAGEAALARHADRVVAPTDREKRNLVRHCGAPAEKVTVIPCGVNLERFRPGDRAEARRRLGLDRNEPVVLFVGRFAPVKGVERLLQAFGRLSSVRPARLLLVGGDDPDAPAARRVREAARSLGLGPRVSFVGRVDQGDLPPYYSAADVLAVPSHYESFGLVALESLACGTPVVATPVGPLEELLGPGGPAGRVCEPTPEGIARGLEAVLPQAPFPGTREANRRAVRRYAWPNVASEILAMYRDLTAGPAEEGFFGIRAVAGGAGSA